jgi:hypothetical protein
MQIDSDVPAVVELDLRAYDSFVAAVDALRENPPSLAPLNMRVIVPFAQTPPETLHPWDKPLLAQELVEMVEDLEASVGARPFQSLWSAPGVEWEFFWQAHDKFVASGSTAAATYAVDLLANPAAQTLFAAEHLRHHPKVAAADRDYMDAVERGGAPALGWTAAWKTELEDVMRRTSTRLNNLGQRRNNSPPHAPRANSPPRGRRNDSPPPGRRSASPGWDAPQHQPTGPRGQVLRGRHRDRRPPRDDPWDQRTPRDGSWDQRDNRDRR